MKLSRLWVYRTHHKYSTGTRLLAFAGSGLYVEMKPMGPLRDDEKLCIDSASCLDSETVIFTNVVHYIRIKWVSMKDLQ